MFVLMLARSFDEQRVTTCVAWLSATDYDHGTLDLQIGFWFTHPVCAEVAHCMVLSLAGLEVYFSVPQSWGFECLWVFGIGRIWRQSQA